MKTLLILGLLLSSLTTLGQSRTELKERVSRMARRIDVKVYDSNASNTVLRQAHDQLRRILSTLRGGGDSSPMDCINFTLPIYERYHSSSTAIEKAKETCRGIRDLDVFKFVFEKLRTIYSDSTALSRSSQRVKTRNVFGKIDILRFAYDKHEKQYSKSSAVDKALENITVLNIDSLECIETYYPTHSRRYSSSRAMDKTTETCSDM